MTWIYFVIFIIVFWSIINILYRAVWKKNENISVKYGILLIIKRSLKVTISRKVVKLSKIFTTMYFAILVLSLYIIISSILTRLVSGVRNVLVLVPGVNVLGYDLLFFVISAAIALIIHEVMHAKFAIGHGTSVKTFGFALLVFLPLAFVEIDENDFRNAKMSAKTGILSAGVVANFMLALIFLMLLNLMSSGQGLMIIDVERDSLAENIGLIQYDVIYSVNNIPLTSVSVLHDLMNRNSTINVVLELWRPGKGYLTINFTKQPWQSRLGIRAFPAPSQYIVSMVNSWTWMMIYSLFYWMYLVNFSVSIINALPLYITDGGKIMYEILGKNIGNIVNTVCLLLFISMILISSTL